MKQSLVKKLTAGILTGALAISVTACGGNSADTNNASTNADVSAETENSGDVTVINAVTGGSPKPYISVEEDGSYSGAVEQIVQKLADDSSRNRMWERLHIPYIISNLSEKNFTISV